MGIFGDEIDFGYMPRGLKTPKMLSFERLSARKSCLCINKRIERED